MNLMNNPTDGIVHANQFIVTGNNAEANVPEGVTAIYDGDTNRLANGRITGLDNRINTNERVGALSMSVKGYNDRTITILEGRTAQISKNTTCTGTTTITSRFAYGSTLEGTITLYKNGTEVKTVMDNLNRTEDCDGSTYAVVAERYLDGVNIPSTTKNYAPKQQITILGLDTDGNENTIENKRTGNSLENTVTNACKAINAKLITDYPGTWTGTTGWATIDNNGNITGTPKNCGTTNTQTYTVNNGQSIDKVNVTYDVGNPSGNTVKIYVAENGVPESVCNYQPE